MYKLIVGLGNPGVEFENTRHNLGFIVADYLVEDLKKKGAYLKKLNKFNGLAVLVKYKDHKFFILKPQTYINCSGACVASFINYFEINLKDVLVIYDDLSLSVGSFRYRQKGGHGGHNGMRDLINFLKTDEINRLRVGIGFDKRISFQD